VVPPLRRLTPRRRGQAAAESQRPDGLTQMFAPGDHGTNGVLIPDWTLQWIVNARDHAMLTGDFAVTAEILPAILRALAWFERHAGASGLIADLPYWHFMDWAGVGREGEACALNALYAGACEAAAFLCDADEAHGPARRLRAAGARVRAALNARHWDEARGLYTDCVDPRTGAQGRRVSQHGLAAMLLWGDVPELRRGRVAEALGDKRRHVFTAAPPVVPKGETLDEETGIVLANTFFSHFVYDALAREGAPGDALTLMRERFGPMLAAGATTLWESFGPTASLCHGFSATACYQLHAHVLGVRPAAPGYARAIFAPDLCALDWAEGVVPTARGDLRVHLSRTAEGFSARIAAPMPVDIVAPPGFALAGCVEDNGVMHIAFAAA